MTLNAAAGFKRLAFVLATIAVAGAGALTAASYFISADSVRSRVLDEIRAVTGLDPVLRGDGTVALFPSGSVSFADVRLGDGAQPALTAERLTAHLRFFPLLIGRVEIADVTLERPTIAVNIDADGRTNWSAVAATLARGQTPNSAPVSAFSEIRIEHGTVLVREAAHQLVETINDVEMSLAWPSISKSFGASGRFVWHGAPVDASLTLGDFPAALAGNRTGLKLRLASPQAKAALDGSISVEPTLRVEGTLAADAVSLRDALVWSGIKPLPGGGFGRFALKAKANVVAGTIALSGVNVELDGNSAEGVLTFATGGRQTLQGTLAADTLDLTPYISTVRLLASNEHEWNAGRISLEGLSGADVDLRLSAANVLLAGAKIGRTAVAANLRGGQLGITIGEAQAYGGVITGSLALAGSETGVEVKTQLQFNNVDLETCLGQLFGLKRLEGKGNIALNAEGAGDSVLAVTRTLDGTATLSGEKGALSGINVEQLLKRLERRPLSGGGEFRNGRTPYDKINVALTIAKGKVTVDDMKLDGASVRLALNGTASIPARDLDLKGTAVLIASNKTDAFELPFIISGPWDDPLMLPDPEILIRRSGAAAPLLNALHDRETADKVRSVIERLTGGTPAAAPAAVPAAKQPATAQKPE